MRKTVFWFLLAMMIAPWLHALPAQPRPIRTDVSNNPCTVAAPCQTLQAALSRTFAGGPISALAAPTSIGKNIDTDFGATCNGVADVSRAFGSFNSWARAQTLPIMLTIPSGRVCNADAFATGIKNLVVSGGATLNEIWLGGAGIIESKKNNSRVATVKAGSTSMRLLNLRQSSLFRVGNWAVLTGLDTQGEGYPPNQAFFEYVNITAIDAATGQIRFSNPILNS